MELKTLKDICRCPDCESMDESCVDYQVLKEEAISLIRAVRSFDINMIDDGLPNKWLRKISSETLKPEIVLMHFLNINESDIGDAFLGDKE